MRVAIAGAGAVGRSIAKELLENGHEVLLIDKNPRSIKVDSVPRARNGCSPTRARSASLDEASLERCNVVIAATGDDKANLVVSLLAKTEYGVPRVVARINHPNNEWLFNESWGVDVAVSTPRLLSALVEEAVSVGDLVRLMTFRQSDASLVELTMPDDAPLAGQRIGDIDWPARHRAGRDPAGRPGDRAEQDDPLETGDELLFVTSEDVEDELASCSAASGQAARPGFSRRAGPGPAAPGPGGARYRVSVISGPRSNGSSGSLRLPPRRRPSAPPGPAGPRRAAGSPAARAAAPGGRRGPRPRPANISSNGAGQLRAAAPPGR